MNMYLPFFFSFICDIMGDDIPREYKGIGHEVPYIASASWSVARKIRRRTD